MSFPVYQSYILDEYDQLDILRAPLLIAFSLICFTEIALYDAQGKLVYETEPQTSDVIIDVRMLRAGIYTLQIQGELVQINEKLIIVR